MTQDRRRKPASKKKTGAIAPPCPDDVPPALSTDRRLFRASELTGILGISARALWSLTNSGELKSLRIGRSVRYDWPDVEAWLEKAKRSARA